MTIRVTSSVNRNLSDGEGGNNKSDNVALDV